MSGPLCLCDKANSFYSARTAPSKDPINKVPHTNARRSQPGMDLDDIAAELLAVPVAEPGLPDRGVALLPDGGYIYERSIPT